MKRGRDVSEFKKAEVFAKEMVNIFKEHSKIVGVKPDADVGDPGLAQSYVSDEGLSLLADAFNSVPLTKRAAVFSMFLDLLEREKIGYSIEQFGGTVH